MPNFFDKYDSDSDTEVAEKPTENYFDRFDESATPPQTIVARRKPLLPDVLGKEPVPGEDVALLEKAKEAFLAPGLVSPEQVPTGAE